MSASRKAVNWKTISLIVIAVVIGLNLDRFRNGNSVMRLYDKYNGFIPLLGGLYVLLLALGILPRRPKDPEKINAWREKFGPALKVVSPLMMVFGLVLLVNPRSGSVEKPAGSETAAAIEETVPGARPTIFRSNAGTKGPDGWYVAESTAGHFKVKLPAPFNDFAITARNRKGFDSVTSCVGTLSPKNAKFSASLTDTGELITDTQTHFDGFLRGFKADGSYKESKQFQYHDHTALEARFDSAGKAAVIRLIPNGSKVYLLVVEYESSAAPQVAEDIPLFMDSLELAPE